MAKRFRFRLEVVERVRRQERDQHRRQVADAVRAVRQVEDHMARLNEQVRRSVEDSVARQRGGVLDVALVRNQEFHRGWLHRQLANTQLTHEEHLRELHQKRGRLTEATKKLRVIEKLREKKWQRHLQEVRREEQLVSDETAVTRFLRATADVDGRSD